MASTVATNKCRANVAQRSYIDNVTTATDEHDVAWVDMRDYGRFLASLMLISGTGVLTFKIKASATSTGTNPVEVKAHADATVADAAGDNLFLECTSNELAKLGTDLRYVSVVLDYDHADDIAAVTYTRMDPRFAQDGLTADVVA